ncbi:MAG: glycosyltransferase family 4 protein [Verrucomicrobiae bacterium]|nr:glycosyltransferase family 4 protein [Verrucomicrobiae bacterium]
MSRFLFINQYYWPDEAATALLLADLVEDLTAAGHEPTVLCGRGRYACAHPLHAGRQSFGGATLDRVGGTDFGRHTIAGRLTDAWTFARAARRALIRLPRPAAVIALTSPPLIGLAARAACRDWKTPLVLWAQDLYPDLAERLGAIRNRVLLAALRARAAALEASCARILVPGEDMRATLEKRGAPADRLRVIPNWADLAQIESAPLRANPLRRALGWQDDHVLMYAGNVGAAHDLATAQILIAMLAADLPSFRFVIVGDSPRHHRFERAVRDDGVARVTRLPFQPRRQLGETLGAADAHLIAQKPEADGLLVPSKLYGAVAAGRPVIFVGNETAEVGRLVCRDRLGAVVRPGATAAELAGAREALTRLSRQPSEAQRLRDWAREHADRRRRTTEFRRILEEVAA